MDNNQLASLLNVIDNRAKKVLADSKPTYRSLAQVYAIDPANPNFPRVKLAGYTSADDDSFPCNNILGGNVQVGDWVYIFTNGNDLNTAILLAGGGGSPTPPTPPTPSAVHLISITISNKPSVSVEVGV